MIKSNVPVKQRILTVLMILMLPAAFALPVMQASRNYQLQREMNQSLKSIETAFLEARRKTAQMEEQTRFARFYQYEDMPVLAASEHAALNHEEGSDNE